MSQMNEPGQSLQQNKDSFSFLCFVMMAADLRTEVTCCICMEVYMDPVTLACGHSFCRECITKTFDNQHEREYFCPECLRNYSRRPELERNLRLANIAEHFQPPPLEGNTVGIFCSYCVHTSVPAVKACLHCESSLCEIHLKTHSKSPEHVLVNSTTSQEKRKCPIHKRLLEYYCAVDNACICSHCLASDHNGHKVESLEARYKQKKKALKEVLGKMSFKKQELERSLQSLQEHQKKLEGNVADVSARVTTLLRDIRRQLEDLEKRVLAEITRQGKQISWSLSELIQRLESEKSVLDNKIHHTADRLNMTDPLSASQLSEEICSFNIEHNKDKERSLEKAHNSGELDELLIFETLHAGLSTIVTNVSIPVKETHNVSLSASQNDEKPLDRKNANEPDVLPVAEQPEISSHSTTSTSLNSELHRNYLRETLQPTPTPSENVVVPSQDSQNFPWSVDSDALEGLLDISTAGNFLQISDDLRSVYKSNHYLKRLESAERFQCPQVLCMTGVSFGRHSWELEVSKQDTPIRTYWTAGMCYSSINRRGNEAIIGRDSKSWGLQSYCKRYYVSHNKNNTVLPFTPLSQRIRIELDYEAGFLSFYELCDFVRHLYTFTATFTEPLHLIISVEEFNWVRIIRYTSKFG